MEDVIGALAQLGPVGIVLIILIVVGYQWRQSSKGYSHELARVTEWYRVELDRQDADRDAAIASLTRQVSELKDEVRMLTEQIRTEIRLRMTAEEEAHRLRMGGK